ncbi:unnamed protein product [Ectocarpus sp. CCAP 1310/34]|nr:unnamed protein product [Ectocarpus sp. CCAP 1310/34]
MIVLLLKALYTTLSSLLAVRHTLSQPVCTRPKAPQILFVTVVAARPTTGRPTNHFLTAVRRLADASAP